MGAGLTASRLVLVVLVGTLWSITTFVYALILFLVARAVIRGESEWYWLGVPMIVLGALLGIGIFLWHGIDRPPPRR